MGVILILLRSKTPVTNKNDTFTNSPCNPNSFVRLHFTQSLAHCFFKPTAWNTPKIKQMMELHNQNSGLRPIVVEIRADIKLDSHFNCNKFNERQIQALTHH